MGNALKAAQPSVGSPEQLKQPEQQVEQLLRRLSGLSEVELWRVQCCLSQNLLPDTPPVPAHCLRSADTLGMAKTLVLCYHEDGALNVLAAALNLLSPEHPGLSPSRTRPVSMTLLQVVPQPEPKMSPGFVRMFRRRLISRIQKPGAVLDALRYNRTLNAANREVVSAYALNKHKNRALVDLVLRKGHEAQQVLFHILSQSEPFMLKELVDEIREKNFQDSSDLLESLTSDELRCFQWVVADYLPPPYGCQMSLCGLEVADGPAIKKRLEEELGSQRAARITEEVVMKIAPALRAGLEEEKISEKSLSIRAGPLADFTHVFDMKDNMFRLNCLKPGMYICPYTGLVLEGLGDVLYEVVPWDVDFLTSKGLRAAGPFFRFTLLTGTFTKLQLPHCQLLSEKSKNLLFVAHVTGDYMDFITPGQVTDSHVIINIYGFSCFGLVTSAGSSQAVAGLVLLFFQPYNFSTFVVLLPRNVCLTQVRKEFKRRTGAEYLEVIPDCELIPNQMYKLTGAPVTVIQPKISKFLNFTAYDNFLPSFEVRVPPDVTMVMLELTCHVALHPVIGWFFGSADCEVWSQVVRLTGESESWCRPAHRSSEPADVTLQLFRILTDLRSEDLKTFQHLLTLQPNPVAVSRLEDADAIRTVDLMIQQYRPERAKEVAEETLRSMNQNQLAEKLERS